MRQTSNEPTMNLDQIKELLKAVADTDVEEIEVESGEGRIRIRRRSQTPAESPQPPFVVVAPGLQAAPDAAAAPAAAPRAAVTGTSAASADAEATGDAAEEEEGLVMVASPMVGTFYESASPGSPAFVESGDKVEPGQVLCIIEAMKLMNEIEAETAGLIVKRFVANAQPVEYGEALFAIRPA